MTVFVISKYGERLMPTSRLGKVKHMLKDGRAVIYQRNPFTIQLTYETTAYTQELELCMDTGYEHIGLSMKSEQIEFISEQRDLLPDEKERHDAQRKYRRTRRNRKRHRAPRFKNRRASKKPGWLPPSIRNKLDMHHQLIDRYMSASPIMSITPEVGQFDTQVLQAIMQGKPIPEGLDYQHGPNYGHDTLREAVFHRDNHTCIFCGRSIKDGAILHVHHLYYWRGQHGDRIDELGTVCELCHTPQNHEKGGKLWGYDKKMPRYTGAAFINAIKWQFYNELKEKYPDIEISLTYGSVTKRTRLDLGLEKSHANDAYCMGKFRPPVRAETQYYKKHRRNNRVLSKFYGAKYNDARTGEKVSGASLFNGRINRNHKKDSENLHKYRKQKISKGRVSTRTKRYPIQSGDTIIYRNKKHVAKGCQNYGRYITTATTVKAIPAKQARLYKHIGGWST